MLQCDYICEPGTSPIPYVPEETATLELSFVCVYISAYDIFRMPFLYRTYTSHAFQMSCK